MSRATLAFWGGGVQWQAITPGSYKAKNKNSDLFVYRVSARDSPSMRREEPVLLQRNSMA